MESNEFEKDKKIKDLEKENINLRNQIIKLNDDLIIKADDQLANFEKEFNNKNTNENINSEINQLILGNLSLHIIKICKFNFFVSFNSLFKFF